METKKPLSVTNESNPSLKSLQYQEEFIDRHIGPDQQQIQEMLDVLGLESLERLIEKTVPATIALEQALTLGEPMT